MKIKNNEKGSLTLFVTLAMLFFMIFLVALYVSTTNEQRAQLAITARIKEIYEKDLDNVEEIYNDFIGTDEYIPIYTAEQLKKVGTGENVYISEIGKYYTFDLDSNYILKNNIELNKYTVDENGTITFDENAEQWIPIGTSSKPFTGILDGNGYKIEGLYINNSTLSNQGLFGYNSGEIKNILLINHNITSSQNLTDGIVVYNQGIIENCYNTENISSNFNQVEDNEEITNDIL